MRTAGSGRVVVVAACAFALEAALYSAAVPLLPHFRDELDLSRLAAGTLAAAYPAGQLVGALLAGALMGVVGVRRVSAAGFALLAGGTLAFGLAPSSAALDVSRLVQGAGGGLAWVGALAWLIGAAGPDRRGAAVGSALSATLVGALIGPLLGTVAATAGVAPTFAAISVAAVAIGALVVAAQPRGAGSAAAEGGDMGGLRRRPVTLLLVLNLLPGWYLGGTNLLVPLRLDDLGAGATAVGATFVVSAAVSALVSPTVGRMSDRHGTRTPVLAGLTGLAGGTLLLAAPRSALVLAVLTVLVVGAGLMVFSVPVMSELNARAAAAGVPAGMAAAVINVAFSVGELAGAQATGVTATAASDLAALALLAVAGLAGAIVYARVGRLEPGRA